MSPLYMFLDNPSPTFPLSLYLDGACGFQESDNEDRRVWVEVEDGVRGVNSNGLKSKLLKNDNQHRSRH